MPEPLITHGLQRRIKTALGSFSEFKSGLKSHNSTDPCIPIALSSNNLIHFYNDTILIIRDKNHCLLPSIGTIAVKPDIYLDCFSPIDPPELTSTISSFK